MNYESRIAAEDQQHALPSAVIERRRPWWIWVAVAVAAIAVIAAVMMMRGGGAAEEAKGKGAGGAAQAPTVTVVVPGRSTVAREITGTGTLAARREMPVGVAGEGGMVTRVLVEPGQWVGAGQVLATVDRSVQQQTAASQDAQVRVARADAQLAQAELDRAQSLVDRGFISKADLQRRQATRDQTIARVRVAEAQAAETRARNRRLDIRAPAAGLVLTRSVEPGQIISSGSGQLFRIAQGGQLELRAQLAESDLVQVPVGARAQVTPVGTDRSFSGEVWQVSPVIDPQTRQGIARVALRYDRALRPGGFAAVSIASGSREAPLLPESAVLSDGRGSFVYVVGPDNKVVRRDVTIGEVSNQGVAIATGLAGSERVVLSAGAFLNPDQLVRPQLQKAR
jgi:RND family efflux transporter MFP subunit